MADKISRTTFNRELAGKSIDVPAARSDARLGGIDVSKADLNRDGKVSGAQETDRLFTEIDRIDRDGSIQSMNLTTEIAKKVGAVGDLSGSDGLKAIALRAEGGTKKANDKVLMVGMNAGAKYEAAELRKRGADVAFIGDAAADDTIVTGGKTYNLANDADVAGFVATLGLGAAQAAKVADAIKNSGTDAKDELAQLAQVWAKAEKGQDIPSRLVLSGHSVGSGVWGDDNGTMRMSMVAELAQAMPEAARSIQDLHIAGCYSGGKQSMEKWRAIFPKVQTIWAYTGSAPGSYSGATAHQSRWDAATRGDKTTLSRDIVAGTRKGENVATWSVTGGYSDGRPPEPLSTARERVTDGLPTYNGYFSGQQTVQDTQEGPLRDYYNDLQALLQHPDLPASDRPALELQRDKTIRLIFYSTTVAPKFQAHHQAAIQQGFTAAGLPVPDFGTLTRKQALEKIRGLEQAIEAMPTPPLAASSLLSLLRTGLEGLSPTRIPDAWV